MRRARHIYLNSNRYIDIPEHRPQPQVHQSRSGVRDSCHGALHCRHHGGGNGDGACCSRQPFCKLVKASKMRKKIFWLL